jgi:tripartite-type tricarboxylate transporter receptor subunit TctC
VVLPRRTLLRLAAGVAALPAISRVAAALDYPTRPVRLVVGLPAGGAPDVVTRLIALWLSERLGQPFVVENRPGAGTNIATEMVVRSAPDGYTLLICLAPNAINATLYDNLKFNFIRDIVPVAGINRVPFIMEVNPAFPARTVAEFIAYAKANPGELNMASTGTGNLTHVTGELFKMMAGVDMLHVPYRGEIEAQADLLGDRAQVMFDPIISSIGYIRNGRLRALAVTTATRSDALPGIPTVGEFVPGYEVSGWQGVGAPAGTPPDIVSKLNEAINAGLADPLLKARLGALGSEPMAMTSAEFGKFLVDETEKWAKVIRVAGIRAE